MANFLLACDCSHMVRTRMRTAEEWCEAFPGLNEAIIEQVQVEALAAGRLEGLSIAKALCVSKYDPTTTPGVWDCVLGIRELLRKWGG